VTPQEARTLAQHARQALALRVQLRMPKLRDLGPSEKVDKLEDYLVDLAVARAELEEQRFYLQEALGQLLDQWDAIKGWEAHLGYDSRPTQEAVRRAKREIKPELHDAINELKRLVARLSEAIDRLGGMGDEQVASRLYTLITGGG
jgi:chromosome segregation ATPase